MDLSQQQGVFASALQDPANTAFLLPLLMGEIETNQKRIGLYRGNVVANAQRALSAIYPVLQEIVGEDFFAGLARAFWKIQAPDSGDWNQYGRQLPYFLAEFEHAQHLPYLSDVARLEWAVHQAVYAADEPENAIRAEPDVLWRPGTQILISSYPIADIWLAHQASDSDELSQRLEHMRWVEQGALIFRESFAVKVLALPVEQAQVLGEYQQTLKEKTT
ncbi:MAG: DNA-binding domain-containing protein [Burkholderiaceae bacterium]|nr:DNA-binding domain-containing protein [Burkholderiaceae bacterium]